MTTPLAASLWQNLACLGLAALCLYLILFYILPLGTLRNRLRRLAEGNYTPGLIPGGAPLIRDIALEIDGLRDRLASQQRQISDEGFSLRAILSSMSEGVLIADPGKRVRLVNAALIDMFGIKVSPLNKTVMEVFRSAQLNNTLEAAFQAGLPQQVEFTVQEGGYDSQALRHFVVNAVVVEAGSTPQPLGVVAVFHDITELRNQQMARQELMANVSHELRTPLSIIGGYIETLLDDDLDDKEMVRHFLVTMQKHSERLNFLIEDTMTISRLESRSPGLMPEDMLLKDCIQRVLERFESTIAVTDAEVRVDIPPDLPPLRADPDRMDQVFFNLIDNALKYIVRRRPIIRIQADVHGDNIEIAISDNGPGIAPHLRENIFQRFYRIEKDRARDSGGTGLGLAIVKNVITAHGGAVRVADSDLGGARFEIVLPLEGIRADDDNATFYRP